VTAHETVVAMALVAEKTTIAPHDATAKTLGNAEVPATAPEVETTDPPDVTETVMAPETARETPQRTAVLTDEAAEKTTVTRDPDVIVMPPRTATPARDGTVTMEMTGDEGHLPWTAELTASEHRQWTAELTDVAVEKTTVTRDPDVTVMGQRTATRAREGIEMMEMTNDREETGPETEQAADERTRKKGGVSVEAPVKTRSPGTALETGAVNEMTENDRHVALFAQAGGN